MYQLSPALLSVDYKIWFRHDSEPEISFIPYIRDDDMKTYSLEEFTQAAHSVTITHLYIIGDLPPDLHTLVPYVQSVRLESIPAVSQLER